MKASENLTVFAPSSSRWQSSLYPVMAHIRRLFVQIVKRMSLVSWCHLRRVWHVVVLAVLGVTLLTCYLTQSRLRPQVKVTEVSESSPVKSYNDEIFCLKKVYISCPVVETNVSLVNINDGLKKTERVGGSKQIEDVHLGKGQSDLEKIVAPAIMRDRHKMSDIIHGSPGATDGLARIRDKVLRNAPLQISVVNVPKYFKHMVNKTGHQCGDLCLMSERPPSESTDVVIACSVSLHDRDIPTERWPGQLYVAYSREAPIHYGEEVWKESSPWRYAFNLTASYQVSTDIFCPYDNLELVVKPKVARLNYEEIAAGKTKMAVWIVSNCQTESLRHIYVQELQKYIDVDIYGNCGQKLSCPYGGDCYKEILKQYKFYLAFENSYCEDYITEKLFKTFTDGSHIIPVVRGGGNYEAYFPNKTFINTADFTSPRELALHLRQLAADVKKLSEYLEHRDKIKLLPRANFFCHICGKLREGHFQPKIYDFLKWMSGQCHPPTDLGFLPNQISLQ